MTTKSPQDTGLISCDKLLTEARNGSKDALGRLLAHCDRVLRKHGLVPRQLRSKFDSSDLCQETSLTVLEAFRNFKGTTFLEFLGWVRRVEYRRADNLRRSYQKTQMRDVQREVLLHDETQHPSLAEQLRDRLPSPVQQVCGREAAERIEQAMARLSPNQRRVVHLHVQEGQPLGQVASQLQMMPGLVQKPWASAHAFLQRRLQAVW